MRGMNELIPIEVATTPITSTVTYINEGVEMLACLMRYDFIGGKPCAVIQYLDEFGDVFTRKNRPYWAGNFTVYTKELFISKDEIEFMSDLVH